MSINVFVYPDYFDFSVLMTEPGYGNKDNKKRVEIAKDCHILHIFLKDKKDLNDAVAELMNNFFDIAANCDLNVYDFILERKNNLKRDKFGNPLSADFDGDFIISSNGRRYFVIDSLRCLSNNLSMSLWGHPQQKHDRRQQRGQHSHKNNFNYMERHNVKIKRIYDSKLGLIVNDLELLFNLIGQMINSAQIQFTVKNVPVDTQLVYNAFNDYRSIILGE